MIVLDTNVASELMRRSPEPAVTGWIRAHPGGELCTTAITLAEIRYGIDRLPAGRRRDLLTGAAFDVFAAFAAQVLPFDAVAATHYATIVARRDHSGRPIDGFDAQIAAICLARRATLATRNTRDFAETGVAVIDPWQSADPGRPTPP
jgi:toxin FitB